MRRKIFHCIIASGLLLFSFSAIACQSAPTNQNMTGNAIKAENPVKRIISLSPSSTEMVYYLGLQERLVGVTEFCNYPPEALEKERVGGFSTVDVEKAVSLQPDLVLAADIHSKATTPMLEKLGFHVVTFKPRNMKDVIADLNTLAEICSVTSASENKINALTDRIEYVTEKTCLLTESQRQRTLVIIWHDPLMVSGGDTLVDDIVHLAGGTNMAKDVPGHANFSIEAVLNSDPEVIIVPSSMGQSGNQLLSNITSDSRLKNVSALKNNAVYRIDGDIILRYGPRCTEALEQVAALLHPQLFGK